MNTQESLNNNLEVKIENEKTIIVNGRNGWTGETRVSVSGHTWHITTSKNYRNIIHTHCVLVQQLKGGGIMYQLGGQSDENFNIYELPADTRCTEKTVKEAHYTGLKMFFDKAKSGELPNKETSYKIEVGQVIFTDGPFEGGERAIYEIEGDMYKTVYLDGSAFKIDDAFTLRPATKKYGIGVYYKEGEKIEGLELETLVKTATENTLKRQEEEKIRRADNEVKEKAKEEYLAQFEKADRRTHTNILKKYIVENYHVSRVEIKTDYNSMNVSYFAPEKLVELEDFLKGFRHGTFNGMEDIYEHFKGYEAPIISNTIMLSFGYVFVKFEHGSAPEPKKEVNIEPIEVEADEVSIIDYSEKAIAVIGDTKPIKDKLRELGGRFNFRLSCGPGWIFPKTKLEELKKALTPHKDGLRQEVANMVDFFEKTDIEIYGEITEQTEKIKEIQQLTTVN